MPTQHKNIEEADLHESKGASTATINTVPISNGAGSTTWGRPLPYGSDTAATGTYFVSNGSGGGTWKKPPYGSIYFENIGTPYSLTYPSSFTKLSPTTTPSALNYLVTEGVNAKLTYTGPGEVMEVTATLSAAQASGADRDLHFKLYKNGVAVGGSSAVITASSASKRFVTLSADVSLATNDYIEVYTKNLGASGDIAVYTFSLYLNPH